MLDQGAYPTDQVPQVVVTMTLMAGLIMVGLGLLKLGKVVTFISNAVMTGFVMGVAILIMVGKLDEIVGYDPEGHANKVIKAVAIVAHPGQWDLTTTVVGFTTIAAALGLKAVPKLERYALVLVVIAGTALVWIFGVDTPTIADQATIATGFDASAYPDQQR